MTHAKPFIGALLLAVANIGLAARDARFEQAENLRHRKPAEAIVLYQEVLARPEIPIEDKLRCQSGIIDCLRQQKKHDEALALARKVFAEVAPDHWMRRHLTGIICDSLSQLNRLDEAAAQAAEASVAAGDDRDAAADWRLRGAMYHQRNKRYAEAYEQAAKAAEIARESEDHRRIMESLWLQSDAMFSAQDYEKSLLPAKQSLELKYDDLPPSSWHRIRQRIVDCYAKLNRPDDVRQAYRGFLATEPDPSIRQRWWLGIARSFEAEKNLPEAIKAWENLITDHADSACRDLWYEAISAIYRDQVQLGDNTAILLSARMALDAADTKDRISSLTSSMVGLLKKADGNIIRAKAFAVFQQQGRAGPDGQLGTADDLADPLEPLGYPPMAARIEAFTKASAKLGGDAQASLHRGWMCIYIGRPREAVAWFLDACRRGSDDEYQAAVQALLFSGVRAATGSASEVERFADYVLHGPTGPDSKAQWPDPFASIIAPPTLPAAPLTKEQRDTLAEVQKRLAGGLEHGLWPAELRLDAAAALARLHGGLGDWNAPGLLDWYIDRIKAETVTKNQEALFPGALAAARGGDIHMSGMRRYLASLDFVEGKATVRETIRKGWYNWMNKIEALSRSKSIVPKLNPK